MSTTAPSCGLPCDHRKAGARHCFPWWYSGSGPGPAWPVWPGSPGPDRPRSGHLATGCRVSTDHGEQLDGQMGGARCDHRRWADLSRPEAGELVRQPGGCLLYTSDAADEEDSVDLGGRRIIKKK